MAACLPLATHRLAQWSYREACALNSLAGAVTQTRAREAPGKTRAALAASLEGKWKVSQNKFEANRRSILADFNMEESTREMAELVRTYGKFE